MELSTRRCVPCEGGVPPLDRAAADALLPQIPTWEIRGHKLHRTLHFESFPAAMAFLQRLGVLAEEQGHHPDFCVHYRKVAIDLWTHAVGGLTENDFVLAAHIDRLVDGAGPA